MSLKLTADTGKDVGWAESKTFIRQHQSAFPTYWAWLAKVENAYMSGYPLCTRDGWYIWTQNPSILSVKNFPIQGNGASIMRSAIALAHDAGLKILCPLHDAIYIEHNENDEEAKRTLAECMDKAVTQVLGDRIKIRGDEKTITSSDVWVEKKGKAMYESLKQYIADDFLMFDEKSDRAHKSAKRRK